MSRAACYVIASLFAGAAALSACSGSTPASTTSSPAPAAQRPAPSAAGPQTSPAPAMSGAPSAAAATALPDGLPPLPVAPFPIARPPEIVRAVFTFAARHPEVLSKVPCFCGCENRGHRNNDDCFVSSRDASGRVTAWEPHGLG